jgi:hypothetical protein
MNELKPLLDLFSNRIPWLMPTLAALMAIRLPMKLLSGWLQGVLTRFVERVAVSPETDDDEMLRRILGSIWYRFLAFTLDAFFSLKLPTADSLTLHQLKPEQPRTNAPIALMLCLVLLAGCAPLQPGADPIVVRTEQAEQGAKATFQLALQTDQLDRGFWRTNAPGFHSYCENLRIPTPYQVTNTLPRYRVMLLSLNDVKLDYKHGRASSNDLHTALLTLQSLQNQANIWLTIVTNK